MSHAQQARYIFFLTVLTKPDKYLYFLSDLNYPIIYNCFVSCILEDVFTSEWLKYNYGVFDERGYYGNEMFPEFISEWGRVIPNGCTDATIHENFDENCLNLDQNCTIHNVQPDVSSSILYTTAQSEKFPNVRLFFLKGSFLLKGQFTPETKSVRHIWDVNRNILLIHFGEMFINYN